MWFLKCLFDWVGASVSGKGGWEEVGSRAEAPARATETGANEPEERKQLRWRQNAFRISFPSQNPRERTWPQCVCVCWKENRLCCQINLYADSLSASYKPGLWGFECDALFSRISISSS